MKSFALVVSLLFASLSFASAAEANEFFSDMEKIFARYDLCDSTDSEQVQNETEFKLMFDTFKIADAQSKTSNIEVSDFVTSSASLRHAGTKRECTMHIDGYDGRCYVVLCQ